MRILSDAKYEKADLHKVVETQYKHLTITQHNELLQLLQKIEVFFNRTLSTRKKDTVDFELEEDTKPI